MEKALRREPTSILAQLADEQIDPDQLAEQYGIVYV